MTRDELVRLHEALTTEARELLGRKSHDYASSTDDALATLRSCGVFGVPPTTGVVVRLLDKLGRLQSLGGRDPQVTGESVKDTVIDIVNYAVLWYALYRGRHEQQTVPRSDDTAYVEAYSDWCIGRFGYAPSLKPEQRERVIAQLRAAAEAARKAPEAEAVATFGRALAAAAQNWGDETERTALYRLLESRGLVPAAPGPFATRGA